MIYTIASKMYVYYCMLSFLAQWMWHFLCWMLCGWVTWSQCALYCVIANCIVDGFCCLVVQESRAATRKPSDAEAILFGLMFANQANLTKENRLRLIGDLNANLY